MNRWDIRVPAGFGDFLVTLTDGTVTIDRFLWEDSDFEGHTERWRDHDLDEIVAFMPLPLAYNPKVADRKFKEYWTPTGIIGSKDQ